MTLVQRCLISTRLHTSAVHMYGSEYACVPSYHCHHPPRPAGCWRTVVGQKRWDPESSTGSSENHLSSTCHILEGRKWERKYVSNKNDMFILAINFVSSRPQLYDN